MSVHLDIANAVVAKLNAAPLSLSSERGYLVEHDLPDLVTQRVTVVPAGLTVEAQDRDAQRHDYVIDVAVEKKPASLDPDDVDGLMDVVESVVDAFRGKALSGQASAKWMAVEVMHQPERMVEFGVFAAIVRLTYRVRREATA